MLVLWGSLAGLLLYLEMIYHLSGFGFHLGNPLFTILVIFTWSAAETLIVGCLRGRAKTAAFQVFLWFSVVWTGAQVVYLHIFKQPMLWEAIFQGGQDALTNYWREALRGIWEVTPFLVLLLLPAVAVCVLLAKKKFSLPRFGDLQMLRMAVGVVACFAAGAVYLETGRLFKANYYENYTEFFDPLTVAEEMGVHSTLQRDTALGLRRAAERMFAKKSEPVSAAGGEGVCGAQESGVSEDGAGGQGEADGKKPAAEPDGAGKPQQGEAEGEEAVPFVPVSQEFDIDFEKLASLAKNKKQAWLAEYIQTQKPTTTNAYTGIFEGYNLIFLTAEGFSPYAVREDLTPTLHRLIHSGFVFENYYVPLWQTSTSDGEYVNCTGLIPSGQFSMKKSASNRMPYTLAAFFNRAGVQSRAYHNNSLAYYDRYRTHPNLGYLFKACRLGGLSSREYGQYLFEMKEADRWPASDYEMMVGTTPEYLGDERFHVYYMTVSGHMNYNFQGNSMSLKNRDLVEELPMSENARAYIACNIELDRALEYLLEQLEEAGKLEKTVIVMSADHYPYAMTQEQYEELAGETNLTEWKRQFRNHLILWNAAYEEEPVTVKKACCSMDLVPTLLNLFGFPFDSRMYAGRDIFSEEEGMVIFNDRSFVTDRVIYDRKSRQTLRLTDEDGRALVSEEELSDYLERKQQEVRDRYQFSAYVLQENYYQSVEDALSGE